MNLRQKAKKLKQENDLLRHIVKNCPDMERVYNLWNQPKNIIVTYKDIHKYKSVCYLQPNLIRHTEYIELCKRKLLDNLATEIQPYVKYTIDVNRVEPVIEANIYVAEGDYNG